MGIGLNSLYYGVLYLGSHYNTGPCINFPHFGNSNLGKLPYGLGFRVGPLAVDIGVLLVVPKKVPQRNLCALNHVGNMGCSSHGGWALGRSLIVLVMLSFRALL